MKSASRRWPVHIFYNVIDMALINIWVIYKVVCKSNISSKGYIQKVCKEVTGSLNDAMESMTFERCTRSSTASLLTKTERRECDSLLQKIAARVLANRAKIEKLTSV